MESIARELADESWYSKAGYIGGVITAFIGAALMASAKKSTRKSSAPEAESQGS
jgi:hypothetical protein